MKIKTKEFKERTCCGDHQLYQLSGWESKDWMCADDILRELMESEADYQIIPKAQLVVTELKKGYKILKANEVKELAKFKKAYQILMDYFDFIPDEEKAEVDKKLKKLDL